MKDLMQSPPVPIAKKSEHGCNNVSSISCDSNEDEGKSGRQDEDDNYWIEQLSGCPESLNQAMLIACRHNDVVSLKKIVNLTDIKPETYLEPKTYRSALWYASACGSNDVLVYLLSRGARSTYDGTTCGSTDENDGTSVRWEDKFEEDESQTKFQENAASKYETLFARSSNGTSPLHIAVGMGRAITVSLLIQYGADINEVNEHGSTPIMLAVDQNYLDVLNVLLDKRADANKCNYMGMSPLHVACVKGRVDALKILYSSHKGIDFQQIDGEGKTCYALAFQYNHVDIMTFLCSIANTKTVSCPNPPDLYQLTNYPYSHIQRQDHALRCRSLLHITSSENNPTFLSIILSCILGFDKEKGVIGAKHKIEGSFTTQIGDALFTATILNHYGIVKCILDMLEVTPDFSLSVITNQSHTSDDFIVNYDLTKEENILKGENGINDNNDHLASQPVISVEQRPMTPLFAAIVLEFVEIVQLLVPASDLSIACYPPPGIQPVSTMSFHSEDDPFLCPIVPPNVLLPPLILATYRNDFTILSTLLKAKDQHINITDGQGHTAISIAARWGLTDSAKILLTCNDIDLTIRSKRRKGGNPLQKAKKYKHVEMVKLLESYIKDKEDSV